MEISNSPQRVATRAKPPFGIRLIPTDEWFGRGGVGGSPGLYSSGGSFRAWRDFTFFFFFFFSWLKSYAKPLYTASGQSRSSRFSQRLERDWLQGHMLGPLASAPCMLNTYVHT